MVAKFLKEDRAFVSSRKQDGETPLHLAARMGHVEVAKLLLASGAKVNAVDNDDNMITALHWAARCSGPEMVALLLANHADRSAITSGQQTPLDWASDNESKEVIRLLEQ